ncbi:alpha/beta hydrolase [Hymenobacter sp.]|uniref:alpha/beta fold hydrolase n=1 Tax=Hymenobacter sp. TaxID=1898978 RepID=UPI00286C3CEE|nr:alpha/beta hydrolase [Hymenobacter sp.]
MSPTTHFVPRGAHRLHAQEYPDNGPVVVLLHGFPDNLHLYDALVPYLVPHFRVIAFDFLGWGHSDKPASHAYTFDAWQGDLGAVLDYFALTAVTLVAHDASGPPAIDWAQLHPDRMTRLVLLNTFYSHMATRTPEAILLFSTPVVRAVARVVARAFGNFLFRRMFWWQIGRFMTREADRQHYIPLLYAQFAAESSSQLPFFALNRDLLPAIIRRTRHLSSLRGFAVPVQIIFGALDPYLNARVAQQFHQLFPGSELHLLPHARHFVQIDAPAEVAGLLRQPAPATTLKSTQSD